MASVDLPSLSALGAASLAWPVWLVAALAATIVVWGIRVSRRPRRRIGSTLPLILVALAATAFSLIRIPGGESSERAALAARQADLNAHALLPGAALACLTAGIGEAVETGCEHAIFSRPENAAGAVAFTAARLALLADALDYAKRREPSYAESWSELRRLIELDRFGLAAQILATRDGCSSEQCPYFGLLQDTSALKANIKAHAFDGYVARYAESWKAEPVPPAAERVAPPADAAPTPQAETAPPPVASRFNFPSSASIPPVSIMNAEPALPRADGAASEATDKPPDSAAAPKLPLPPKRPQSQAAAPPAR